MASLRHNRLVRRLWRAGVVVLTAAVMAACSHSPAPTPALDPGPGSGSGSLEGTFTVDSIDEFLDIVSSQLLTPWFHDTWPDVAPPKVNFVPAGTSGTQGCAFDDESLAFCADVPTVYVGQT